MSLHVWSVKVSLNETEQIASTSEHSPACILLLSNQAAPSVLRSSGF
jgi:hypothetical protein